MSRLFLQCRCFVRDFPSSGSLTMQREIGRFCVALPRTQRMGLSFALVVLTSTTRRLVSWRTCRSVGLRGGSVLICLGSEKKERTMMRANHALQRIRRERRGCHHCLPCAGSLSLCR